MNAASPIDVPVAAWRDRVRTLLKGGARFTTLYADRAGSVRCVMTGADGVVHVLRSPGASVLPSIVGLAPAAGWAEREAHDCYGVDFEGHEPMRPLVQHGDDWRIPVTGEGVHEIAVGPIHAGIIESGHFRIHAVGELILLIDVRLFYKRRGLETAAEGSDLADAMRFVQRACAGCAVANSLAYTLAAEQLLGVAPPPGVARLRTLLLELERLWNHLNDLSAMYAGVGFAAGAMAFAALKEEAQRLNHRLFGHRFLFDTVSVHQREPSTSAGLARDVGTTLATLAKELDVAWRAMIFNASVQERLRGTGTLTHKKAIHGGAVGPAARASGVHTDVRTSSPALAYGGFQPVRLDPAAGDVAARAAVRHAELLVTVELIAALVNGSASPPTRVCEGEPQVGAGPRPTTEGRVGVGRVESARGETVCCLEARGGTVQRVHLRTASYANWPLVAEAARNNLVGEFPIINKSFELCYACVDR